MFLRIVSSMLRSFFPGHIEEHDEPDQCDKEHSPGHRSDDQAGQLVIGGAGDILGNVEDHWPK